MAMTHSAFIFDYKKFEVELRPILLEALETGSVIPVRRWIDANRKALVDPYEGESLPENWQKQLPDRGIQSYGDFALTKFYDPTETIGLDEDWEALGVLLKESELSDAIILGTPLGLKDGLQFDPGTSGSYFQTPEEVSDNLVKVEGILERSPELAVRLKPVVAMLVAAKAAHQGLYITF